LRNASIFCFSSHVFVVYLECVNFNQDAGDEEAHLASFEKLYLVVPNVSALICGNLKEVAFAPSSKKQKIPVEKSRWTEDELVRDENDEPLTYLARR